MVLITQANITGQLRPSARRWPTRAASSNSSSPTPPTRPPRTTRKTTSSRSSWAATRGIRATSGPSVGERPRIRSRPGTLPAPPGRAKSKDATENALHREVCAGTLTLREAQWIIATHWFKYFREKVLHW